VRLPFPERIPFKPLFYFAALLCAVQMVERTNATFSLCCFFFIIFAGLAFNIAGGFTRPSGAYIFFYSTLAVIVGLVWKAVLGESADSNLQTPLLTIYIYLAASVMMLVAAYVSRRVTLKRPILGDILPDYKLQTATVGCTLVSFLIVVVETLVPTGNASVESALNQINHFFPLAIILGVLHTIRRTGGRRCINFPVALCCGFMFFMGVINFSKEGMFGPLAAVILAAASQHYRVSRYQVLGAILMIFLVFRYLVPFSQYGRNFKEESATRNAVTAYTLLTNLGEVREAYLNTSANAYETEQFGYYNSPQGFFDRLQMISIDDALIDNTEKLGTFGFLPVIQSFENIVPHFIWKNKPTFQYGNTFAHEVGILGEEDESTGVSFSATSSAFHMVGWKGIFFLVPAIWFILFWVYDSLCGDVRKTPWGLIVMVMFTHAAPEGDVTSVIYLFSTGAFGVVFCSVLAAYLMPIIGTLLIGPEGIFLKKMPPVRSVPSRRLHPLSSPLPSAEG
jgi:hypothetical protein